MPSIAIYLGVILAALAFVMSLISFQSSSAQMDMHNSSDSLDMTGAPGVIATSSPVVYPFPDSNMEIRLSWEPEMINANDTTRFTFEFLNATTKQRIPNVSFAVHMTLDGKSMGHAHEATAADGIGTVEQEFDSMGNLAIIVESIEVDDSPITGLAQFNLNVVPEFPVGFAVVTACIIGSAILTTRIARIMR